MGRGCHQIWDSWEMSDKYMHSVKYMCSLTTSDTLKYYVNSLHLILQYSDRDYLLVYVSCSVYTYIPLKHYFVLTKYQIIETNFQISFTYSLFVLLTSICSVSFAVINSTIFSQVVLNDYKTVCITTYAIVFHA